MDEGADDIDGETEDGDGDGLFEADELGTEEAAKGFGEHVKGDQSQDDGAGVTAEHAHLGRAEGVAFIGGIAPGKPVGAGGYGECGDVGAHVPAIGKEGHGAQAQPADDLDDHHEGGQPEDAAGVGFRFVEFAGELVGVGKLGERGRFHKMGGLRNRAGRFCWRESGVQEGVSVCLLRA